MRPYDQPGTKKEQIKVMFNRIAPKYDTLNHLLSFGIDRRWRKKVVRRVASENPVHILDLATGTGDMALALAKKCSGAQVTGADLSENMLEVASEKVTQKGLAHRITLEAAEAEALPFTDSRFDAATVAFGVRNFHDIPQGLKEMNRVLKQGGKIYILEFSTPRSKFFGTLYRFYFHKVLPFIGGLISKDKNAYKYLPGSVDEFPSPEKFLGMISDAGFNQCQAVSLTAGVAYIYIGTKK